MHNAPAVSYPVGRSRFQGTLIALSTLSGIAVGIAWHKQAGAGGWRGWLFIMSLAAASIVALLAWQRMPSGRLLWDGQAWSWTSADTSSFGVMAVHVDVQAWMVLSLRTDAGVRIWLWPQRSADAMHWSALRQAVFSGRVGSQPLSASSAPGAQAQAEVKS